MRRERLEINSGIRQAEENNRKLRKATADYLTGEISLEEYKELTDEIPGMDLRAIGAELQRREFENKVHKAKEKIKGIIGAIREKVA